MKDLKLTIGIDFDGTCTTHDFPEIGKDIGAIPILKQLVIDGHKLILFTMRSNIESPTTTDTDIYTTGGQYLTDAVNWFKDNGIELYGIQTNPTQKQWTNSPKAYCNLYIDDAGLGIPLTTDLSISSRTFVDWIEVKKLLTASNILK